MGGIDSTDKAAQLKYFQEHGMEIKQKMQDHGAVILRGFDLMKEQDGFQEFYAAIGMKICQDPLQSVAARPTADGQKDSPVYEAVNKESRKNFFIGMHNEFVGTRSPRAAAFVCFKPAEEGGEFLIADGRKMLQARSPRQPPIEKHPVSGEPTWFCNVHSHSSKLRKNRESKFGAERFEDGASQINKSDMYFGDDGLISDEALKEMDEKT